MWKRIGKISSNNSNHTFPTSIIINNEIFNQSDITNDFNKCFSKVAIDTQSSMKFSKEKYFGYLPPLITP